jgi:superfamily II DNA or RNA helicase
VNDYTNYLEQKKQRGADTGFEPVWMPDMLFDFQKSLVDWAIRKGRCALFADCGLGKTIMQLVWAENVVRKTGKAVLILTPLAVASQTVKEAEKFGMTAVHRREGKKDGDVIVVTNYERLHYYNKADYVGVVCDESSILKSYSGATQKNITRFLNKIPYRLLCTATAAPNDWIELGTSSEALGELTHSEMLTRFFRYCDDKTQKKEQKQQQFAEKACSYYQKLSFRVSQSIGQWRLKNHAVQPFWRWVSSWARACQKPSDLGFSDEKFNLPELKENCHIITPDQPREGYLFSLPAFGLSEEREERKLTINQRCEYVADLVNHEKPSVIWCHYNAEGDLLEQLIPEARQISGATPEHMKEEIYNGFSDGSLKKVIIKPKIGAWGLNWQHCSHVVTFATHSYEQYYQSIRRCWRFGQKNIVNVDIVGTEGESRVINNMERKKQMAEQMFKMLVKEMNDSTIIKQKEEYTRKMEVPRWL